MPFTTSIAATSAGACWRTRNTTRGHIVAEVQLTGLDINIARQDVIQNDILYEGSLVVLFVIQRLDIVDRNRNQRADAARQLVLALYEYGVFQTRRTVTRCMISITAETNDLAGEAQLQ